MKETQGNRDMIDSSAAKAKRQSVQHARERELEAVQKGRGGCRVYRLKTRRCRAENAVTRGAIRQNLEDATGNEAKTTQQARSQTRFSNRGSIRDSRQN